MTAEERIQRVADLRRWARLGRDEALARGPEWFDYERVIAIAAEMERDARDLTDAALREIS